jgi:uncharacterized protein YjbJ (UPF0337 family)
VCVCIQVANNVRGSAQDTADKTKDTASKAADKATGGELFCVS